MYIVQEWYGDNKYDHRDMRGHPLTIVSNYWVISQALTNLYQADHEHYTVNHLENCRNILSGQFQKLRAFDCVVESDKKVESYID